MIEAHSDTSALGLYVHFPWCIKKCPYCDFNSHPLKAGTDQVVYLDALLGDWRQQSLVATELDADDLLLAGGGAPEREASARAFARELLVSSRSGGRSTRALGSWYAAVRRLFVTMCHEEAAINPSTSETALCFEVLNRNITSEAA